MWSKSTQNKIKSEQRDNPEPLKEKTTPFIDKAAFPTLPKDQKPRKQIGLDYDELDEETVVAGKKKHRKKKNKGE